MSDALAATRLRQPRPPRGAVSRARLTGVLQAGLAKRLTLLAAPAGYGKTTLVSSWLATTGRAVAWLTPSSADTIPSQFLDDLLAALAPVYPEVEKARRALHAPQMPPLPPMLIKVLHALAADARPAVLVIDDLHLVGTLAVTELLTLVIDQAPPGLHIVLLTRADPPLPLAHWRGSGQLTELREEDLRFQVDEASQFFAATMQLPLSAPQVAAVTAHTRGWAVGLQLAALALRTCVDRDSFIADLARSNRFVLDDLATVVLDELGPDLRRFLHRTSVLDRFCPALCAAVVADGATNDAAALLADIERRQLFLEALGTEGQWSRYHPTFAYILQQRLLADEGVESARAIHRRAAGWFAACGSIADAMEHLLQAGDGGLAADLLMRRGFGLIVQGKVQAVLQWLRAIPAPLIQARPMLCIIFAGATMFVGRFAEAEGWALAAEAAIGPPLPGDEARSVREWAASTRANIARFRGDMAQSIALSREALALAPPAALSNRAVMELNIARAYQVTGVVTAEAEARAAAPIAAIAASENTFALLNSLVNLARLQVLQGRLRVAAATYRRVELLAPQLGDLSQLVGSAAYYIGLGDLRREQSELDTAAVLIDQGLALIHGALVVDADVVRLGFMARARLMCARGDLGAARNTLAAYMTLAAERGFAAAALAPAEALAAQLALWAGARATAEGWARRFLAKAAPPGDYAAEAGWLTLARLRIAQGQLSDARAIIAQLLPRAAEAGRGLSVIEALIVDALASADCRARAAQQLARALHLAAPAGIVRIFLDEGAPLRALLEDLAADESYRAQITSLRAWLAAPSQDRDRASS